MTVTPGQTAHRSLSILFLDKVMAGPCLRPPRGVELFNLNLLRDLAAAGHTVTAAVHDDWHDRILDKSGPHPIVLAPPPYYGINGRHPAASPPKADSGRYNILLLGNIANRLIPSLCLLRLRRAATHCVLIAHREPSWRSIWAQHIWPSTIVAVNQVIAKPFVKHGFERTFVDYGITDADLFYPSTSRAVNQMVNFCVVGNLDNPWKGSDTAVRAFRSLPPEIRARCRLHLASFQQPRDFGDPHIIACQWMPADQIPAFLRRMDVMIVPSHDEGVMRETFSQVMVQGMLSGLPVIATSLPILAEKLDRGGGLVTHDTAAMTGAIRVLAGDPSLRHRMGLQARTIALERYVWDTEKFDRLYLQPAIGSFSPDH